MTIYNIVFFNVLQPKTNDRFVPRNAHRGSLVSTYTTDASSGSRETGSWLSHSMTRAPPIENSAKSDYGCARDRFSRADADVNCVSKCVHWHTYNIYNLCICLSVFALQITITVVSGVRCTIYVIRIITLTLFTLGIKALVVAAAVYVSTRPFQALICIKFLVVFRELFCMSDLFVSSKGLIKFLLGTVCF
jgi:hypothetical protein